MSAPLIVYTKVPCQQAVWKNISLISLHLRGSLTKNGLNLDKNVHQSLFCQQGLSTSACAYKSLREPLTKEDYKEIYENNPRRRMDIDMGRYSDSPTDTKGLQLSLKEEDKDSKKEVPLNFNVGPDNYFGVSQKIRSNKKNIIIISLVGTIAYIILFGKDRENVELNRVMAAPIAELDLVRDGNILRMAMAERALYGKSNKIYQDRLKLLHSEKKRMAEEEMKADKTKYKVIPKKTLKKGPYPEENTELVTNSKKQ